MELSPKPISLYQPIGSLFVSEAACNQVLGYARCLTLVHICLPRGEGNQENFRALLRVNRSTTLTYELACAISREESARPGTFTRQ